MAAEYQGVVTPMPMNRMHFGRFSQIHEKHARLDRHVGGDVDITRLRVYTLCTFARIALSNTHNGGFLTAGVSFATAPLVTAEYLDLATHKRTFYLVDPLCGWRIAAEKGETNYNTDFEIVRSRWNPGVPLVYIPEFLTPDSIKDVPS